MSDPRESTTDNGDNGNGANTKTPRAREMHLQLASGMRVAAKHWGSSKSTIKVMALHGFVNYERNIKATALGMS
jgi:hypothetical protein